jgi:serine/threonine-protein kinase RsbW
MTGPMARRIVTRAERRGAVADGTAARIRPAPGAPVRTEFRLHAAAEEMAVRRLLAALRARLRGHGLPDPACGTVEIVLAEALNNIVEHAYAGSQPGGIALHAALGPDGLTCTLSDRGATLPGAQLPAGRPPDPGTDRETLPEGGFGWFLIRSLTRDVAYAREDGINRLTLRFDLPGPETGDR